MKSSYIIYIVAYETCSLLTVNEKSHDHRDEPGYVNMLLMADAPSSSPKQRRRDVGRNGRNGPPAVGGSL